MQSLVATLMERLFGSNGRVKPYLGVFRWDSRRPARYTRTRRPNKHPHRSIVAVVSWRRREYEREADCFPG